jgi:Protein of unknown function (DUF3108)
MMRRSFSLVFTFMLVLAALARPLCAREVDLNYVALMGVAEAGVIAINLDVKGTAYVLQGSAETRGVLEVLRGLRVKFLVHGRRSGQMPVTRTYEYHHRDKEKERRFIVAAGEVTYWKNGELRPKQPAKKGLDLVSALWMAPSCASLTEVYTARTQYSFRLVKDRGDRCRYSVTSDDPDDGVFDVDIRYTQREGLRVPRRITSTGVFAGTVELIN